MIEEEALVKFICLNGAMDQHRKIPRSLFSEAKQLWKRCTVLDGPGARTHFCGYVLVTSRNPSPSPSRKYNNIPSRVCFQKLVKAFLQSSPSFSTKEITSPIFVSS